jgi:NAD(P)-dependent dehydrogenase (short-subunit alcohol dehydrogenase family)
VTPFAQADGGGPLNEVVVITGGAGGIGRATAELLARRGARLIVVDRDDATVATALASLPARGESLGMALDVRDPEDMAEMARRTLERFGRIDALIAAAGILRAHPGAPRPAHKLTPEEWQRVLDTNLTGVFLSNRAVLPAMVKRGSGAIVNVSSTSGRVGRPFDAAYCASKFGVVGFTEAVAQEVARSGVRVHAVLPGAVDTPLWRQNGPIGAPPDALPPQRVAELIVYLLTLPRDTLIVEPVIVPSGLPAQSSRRVVSSLRVTGEDA